MYHLVAYSAVSASLGEPVLDQAIIDAVNVPGSTWVAGINSNFEGATRAELKSMLGAKTDGISEMAPVVYSAEARAAAPASFDPRNSTCHGPVLDQGFCGSCWAFGATEAISDRLCLSKGAGAKFVQLAPLDLTSCDSGIFAGENGCQGGQLAGAWNYGKNHGLVEEQCYPYLKSQGGPVPTCKPEDQPCLPESKFIPTPRCTVSETCKATAKKLEQVYSVRAENLMVELSTKGPVEGAFTVFSDFVHYKSGVYKHTTGEALGGHAIKIIGYGTEDGTPYWLVQNSWTTTWGDGGYFKIAHGSCGIDEQCVAGTFGGSIQTAAV